MPRPLGTRRPVTVTSLDVVQVPLHDGTGNDRIRRITGDALQELVDAEAGAVIGAGRQERAEEQAALRDGTRPEPLSTTAGDLRLRQPELRTGSSFPGLLERRRRIDRAVFTVFAEAFAGCPPARSTTSPTPWTQPAG